MLGLAALLLLAVGVAIGRRTTESLPPEARPAVTVTLPAPPAASRQSESQPPNRRSSAHARTPDGAVAAASKYLDALSGPAILDSTTVRTTLTEIASSGSREGLIRAYAAAAEQARAHLGVGAGAPVLFRTTPVGYRVDGFHRNAATVSIWRVGIVASGGTVEPQQSWRTETVALVWERGAWKVDAVRSLPGPTPPLAGRATPSTELLPAVQRFREFRP